MTTRLPEDKFLQLCIQRDMAMLGEARTEAAELTRRAWRWRNLECKLLRRMEKTRHRIAIGHKGIFHDMTLDIGVYRTVQWKNLPGGEELIKRWRTKSYHRGREAHIVRHHVKECTDGAHKLFNLADRLEVNATKCGEKLRLLMCNEVEEVIEQARTPRRRPLLEDMMNVGKKPDE